MNLPHAARKGSCESFARSALALGSHGEDRRLICLLFLGDRGLSLASSLHAEGRRRIGHASAEGCQKSWTSRCSRSPESTSCCLLCHHLHTMSLGTHSRQGNTGRPRSEAALLESKLDDSWIASLQSRGFFLLLHAAPTLPRPRPRARILANPARNPGRPTKAPTLPPGLKGGS